MTGETMAARGPDAAALLRALAARTMRYDFAVWFWGDAIAFDGLLDAAELLAWHEPHAFCRDFLRRWAARAPAWTDYLAPGEALRRTAAAADEPALQAAVQRLARWYLEAVPRGRSGLHYFRPDLPQFRTTVLVDSLYHVPPFLAGLGGANVGAAWEVWSSHAEALRHPQGPLLCHNYDEGSGRSRGYGWGRGNGWAVLGLVDMLETMPADHADRPAAVAWLRRLSEVILPLQDASGFWRTLLHDREAYLESSTAAFFGTAFTKAMRLGLLDSTYAAAAERAWAALRSRVDEEGGCFGVSGVTWAANAPTEELALYKSMPTEVNVWGQGAALRFAAERLRAGLN